MRPRRSHPEDLPVRLVLVDLSLKFNLKSIFSLSFSWFWKSEAADALLLSPYAVEHVAVFRNTQQLVVSGDLMEVGPFFIGKEQIRFPNGVQHGRVQVQRVIRVLAVGQPRVVPLLPQEDVHSVVLQNRREESLGSTGTDGTQHQTTNSKWILVLHSRTFLC